MSETRAAVLAAYRAAKLRNVAVGHFPVTAAALAGLLLDHAGTTTRAREYLDLVLATLDQIDDESAPIGEVRSCRPERPPLAKVRP